MKKIVKSNPLKTFNDNKALAVKKMGGAQASFKKSLPKAQVGQSVSDNTKVENPYKKNIPDLSSNKRITSSGPGEIIIKTKEPYTNKNLSTTYKNSDAAAIIKKEKGSVLSATSKPYRVGTKQKYITDTTGYSKGKEDFPTVHTWGVQGGMGDARVGYKQVPYVSKRDLSREEVKNIYEIPSKTKTTSSNTNSKGTSTTVNKMKDGTKQVKVTTGKGDTYYKTVKKTGGAKMQKGGETGTELKRQGQIKKLLGVVKKLEGQSMKRLGQEMKAAGMRKKSEGKAMMKTGGATKTTKFAALAPPYNKATAADRIAGAKKNARKK